MGAEPWVFVCRAAKRMPALQLSCACLHVSGVARSIRWSVGRTFDLEALPLQLGPVPAWALAVCVFAMRLDVGGRIPQLGSVWCSACVCLLCLWCELVTLFHVGSCVLACAGGESTLLLCFLRGQGGGGSAFQ